MRNKSFYTFKDFMVEEADLQLAAMNKSIAIDILVNTIKYLRFEHRDPLQVKEFDYSNPKYR